MSEPNTETELPDLIVLAGDMALHWGVAMASVRDGDVFASMHLDLRGGQRSNAERFDQTVRRIVEFVQSHIDGNVDRLAYESPTPASMSSAASQYRMIAALEEAGRRLGCPTNADAIYPSSLKKWACGHGNAQKHQMVARAVEITGYRIVDDNEADAVCLAAWAVEQVRAREIKKMARRLGRSSV